MHGHISALPHRVFEQTCLAAASFEKVSETVNKEGEHAHYSQYQCFHFSSGVFLYLSDSPEVNSIIIEQLPTRKELGALSPAGNFKKFSNLEEINVFFYLCYFLLLS